MASLASMARRVAQIEAKAPAREVRTIGPDRKTGTLPDNFDPATDRLIYRVIVSPDTHERRPEAMAWRGQPFDPETMRVDT